MRIGIFEVLDDNGEKYDTRKLVVRCTTCATVTERRYASVTQYTAKACIHCKRRKSRDVVVAFLRTGPKTNAEIAKVLGCHRNNVIRILRAMLDDGEIIRYRGDFRRTTTWLYEAT